MNNIIKVLTFLLILGACTKESKKSDPVASCKVTPKSNGNSVLQCADGSSFELAGKQPKGTCSVAQNPDNAREKTITCDDGSKVVILDGKDGASCAVTQTTKGASIRCGDQPAVELLNGADGKSCEAKPKADDSGLEITCGNGTALTLKNGRNGDNCSTQPIDDGIAVQCGEQKAVEIHNGRNGDSCEATPTEKGLSIKCGKNPPIEIHHGDSCQTTPTKTGYSLKCGDHEAVEIHNGADGVSCKASPTETGLAVQCGNGTPVEIHHGNSCSTTPTATGYTLKCGDKDAVEIHNGADGISCKAKSTDTGLSIQCGTSDPIEIHHGDSCATTPTNYGYSLKCGNREPVAIHNGKNGDSCKATANDQGLAVQCGSNNPIQINHGDSCATTPKDNGYSLKCGGKAPVEIHNGENGASCAATPIEKGLSIKCGDQNPIEIRKGVDGESCSLRSTANGNELQCPGSPAVLIKNGTDGTNGTNGTSCTAKPTIEGTEITCGNSVSIIKHGKEGTPGEGCQVKEDEQKLIFSCTNGTKVELQVIDGKIVTTLPVNKPFTFDPASVKTFNAILDLYPDAAKAPQLGSLSGTVVDGRAILGYRTVGVGVDSMSYTIDGGRTYENWKFDFKPKVLGLNEANKKAFVGKDQCIYLIDLTKPTDKTLSLGELEQVLCATAPQEIGNIRMLAGSDYMGVSFNKSPNNFLLYNVRTKEALAIGVLNPSDEQPFIGLTLQAGTYQNGEIYFIVNNSVTGKNGWIKVDPAKPTTTYHPFAEALSGTPVFLKDHLYIRKTVSNFYAHYRITDGTISYIDSIFDVDFASYPNLRGSYRGQLAFASNSSLSPGILYNTETQEVTTLPAIGIGTTLDLAGDYFLKRDSSITFPAAHSFLELNSEGTFNEIKPYFGKDDFARMIWMDYAIDAETRTLKSMEILHPRDLEGTSTNRRSMVYSGGQRIQGRIVPFPTYSFTIPALVRPDVKVADSTTGTTVDFAKSRQSIGVTGRIASRVVETSRSLYFMVDSTLQKINRDLESVKNITPASLSGFRGLAAFGDQLFLWAESGLYVSKDAGNTFTSLPAPELSTAEKYQFDFDGDTLVAATPTVAALSIDKGKHWNRLTLPENTKVETLRIQRSYLFLNFFSASKPMISTDFGKTWVPWAQAYTDAGFLTKDLLCFSNFSCSVLQ